MGHETVVALSPGEAAQILEASPDAVLIGGGALAFWRAGMTTGLPSALSAGVTTDVDFLGGKEAALELARNLKQDFGLRVEVYIPKFGDITPETAKVNIFGYGDRPPDEYVVVDYLGVIYGFADEDEERMLRRAPEVEADTFKFRVMHPIDVLISRIRNLSGLPAKQNDIGEAQARLAVDVMRFWFENDAGLGDASLERHGPDGAYSALAAAEDVIDLAIHRSGRNVFSRHGIDVLNAIPVESFATNAFVSERWPRALAYLEKIRG